MEIRLTDKDKKQITSPDDIYGIMQRILLRENKIDREKEHFWIIGMDMADYILYIELVSLGSVKSTIVEPMNVYRFAVMKNAVRVIAVHNHPSGNLTPSPHDKDTTDRLIQVGRNQKNALIKFLMEKNTATEEIANILKIPPEEVEKATKKKT